MKKFFEIVLKILLIVSCICIIVFVGVVILNNRSIAFEAYNYIVTARDKTNFQAVQTNIQENVLIEYAGDNDPYARYINSAVKELNKGINYYVDYLSQEDALSKGEQDTLINGYKKFINSFNITSASYEEYIKVYQEAKSQPGYLVDHLNFRGIYLVQSYITCYKNGSAFFKDLAKITNKYIMPNISYQTYKAQYYMIKIGLIDYSLDYVYECLDIKRTNYNYARINNANIASFEAILEYEKKYEEKPNQMISDKDSIVDSNFRTFTQTLNELNIYEWAGNNAEYTNTLSDELKEKSINAKTYFDSIFKG